MSFVIRTVFHREYNTKCSLCVTVLLKIKPINVRLFSNRYYLMNICVRHWWYSISFDPYHSLMSSVLFVSTLDSWEIRSQGHTAGKTGAQLWVWRARTRWEVPYKFQSAVRPSPQAVSKLTWEAGVSLSTFYRKTGQVKQKQNCSQKKWSEDLQGDRDIVGKASLPTLLSVAAPPQSSLIWIKSSDLRHGILKGPPYPVIPTIFPSCTISHMNLNPTTKY